MFPGQPEITVLKQSWGGSNTVADDLAEVTVLSHTACLPCLATASHEHRGGVWQSRARLFLGSFLQQMWECPWMPSPHKGNIKTRVKANKGEGYINNEKLPFV